MSINDTQDILRLLWGPLDLSDDGHLYFADSEFDTRPVDMARASRWFTPSVDHVSTPEVALHAAVPVTLVRRLISSGDLRPDATVYAGRGVAFFFRSDRLQEITSKIKSNPTP